MDEKLKKTSFSALNISKQWAYLFAASMLTLAPLSASASESNNLNASKSLAVQQDKKTVSGTVVDANGEPIIGATVKEVGTQNAIITDVNGTFKLNVKPGAMLTVSSVGFKEQTVKASDKVDVTLKEDAEVLEQVVVVGYGTAKRKDVSGAITSVKFDDGKLTNLPTGARYTFNKDDVSDYHYGREAVHNILYTIANSKAMNGGMPGSRYLAKVEPYQKVIYAVDGVCGGLIAVLVILTIFRFRKKKEDDIKTV